MNEPSEYYIVYLNISFLVYVTFTFELTNLCVYESYE